MKIPFRKYHGTGNDFVMIDNRGKLLSGSETAFFGEICHRRFGIGADGVILLNSHAEYDFEMDYFNSDGNRSSMCGNGGRCLVQFAADLGVIKDQAKFIAIDGEHEARLTDRGVLLKMTAPFGFRKINAEDYWLHTGSPHYVRFLPSPLADFDVVGEGKAIRYNDEWREEGTNVNFVHVLENGVAEVRTYERGVEDETWSCGTGVTAVASIMKEVLEDQPSKIQLRTPGGELHVHTGDLPSLEGPAAFVFAGEIEMKQNK